MRQKGNQYAKRVKILKYVKSGAKWRFANVVARNGKIIRDTPSSRRRPPSCPKQNLMF